MCTWDVGYEYELQHHRVLVGWVAITDEPVNDWTESLGMMMGHIGVTCIGFLNSILKIMCVLKWKILAVSIIIVINVKPDIKDRGMGCV